MNIEFDGAKYMDVNLVDFEIKVRNSHYLLFIYIDDELKLDGEAEEIILDNLKEYIKENIYDYELFSGFNAYLVKYYLRLETKDFRFIYDIMRGFIDNTNDKSTPLYNSIKQALKTCNGAIYHYPKNEQGAIIELGSTIDNINRQRRNSKSINVDLYRESGIKIENYSKDELITIYTRITKLIQPFIDYSRNSMRTITLNKINGILPELELNDKDIKIELIPETACDKFHNTFNIVNINIYINNEFVIGRRFKEIMDTKNKIFDLNYIDAVYKPIFELD